MKKLFLFATVAAAGLFAGCSSSDDAIAEGGTAIENVDGDKTAIKIGIGNIVNTATRGTGTVGGVGTNDANNVWAGQRINVFMFTKDENKATTLNLTDISENQTPQYLYNNTVMITPGTPDNKIDNMNISTDEGEAMEANGKIQYYPASGNFDFFGYHGDGITGSIETNEAASPATPATKWWTEFTITGSEDLMTTKAKLTDAQKTTLTTVGVLSPDYYSAKAARKGVQPTLTFKHLLTRLNFKLKAGDLASAGYGKGYIVDNYSIREITFAEYNALPDGATGKGLFADDNGDDMYTYSGVTPIPTATYLDFISKVQAFCTPNAYSDGQDPERAVKVEKIEILSKTTGNLLVAWTADEEVDVDPNDPSAGKDLPEYKKIEWAAVDENNNPKVYLELKARPYATKKDGENVTVDDIAGKPADQLNKQLEILQAELAALTAAQADQDVIDAKNAQIAKKQAEITKLNTYIADIITEEAYDKLSTAGQDKYDIISNNVNEDLMTMTPTAAEVTNPNINANTWTESLVQLGEALLIAPNDYVASNDPYVEAYTPEPLTMKVTISQKVPTNWNYPTMLEYKTDTYPLTIPIPGGTGAGAGAFKINNSYDVVLTVYGFQRIEVIAKVSEWEQGDERHVGGDDDND